tara:strand:- start:211 stop:426 length:216 start_codon:yes stop_codon:yes gene_type:complete
MKKRTKRFLDWFFETDRGEENIANCANLYELVEKLQFRLEDMENEHMQVLCKVAKLQARLDMLESDFSNEN